MDYPVTAFALSIALGPLGSFISAGRRSRDLWWGSTWLAECTAEVASTLYAIGTAKGFTIDLLLPSQLRLSQLRSARPAADGSLRAFHGRVSNHVRARVQLTTMTSESLQSLVAAVESHAHVWLRDKVNACLTSAEDRLRDRENRRLDISTILDRERFATQLDAIANGDFIQLSAGWTPLEETGGLGPALRRADELMIAARRTRPFHPASWSVSGRRKSDLDAGRDGVLHELVAKPERAKALRIRATLGIGEGEQLDALGFARRIAAFEFEESDAQLGRLPFPPISRIAVDPWICRAHADQRTSTLLLELKNELEKARRRDRDTFLTWCTPACDPRRLHKDDPAQHIFPFDASILLENGVSTALELVKDIEGAKSMILGLSRHVSELHHILGVPAPYYALIEADGDGVGSALHKADADPDDDQSTRYQHLVQCLDTYADGLDGKLRPEHGARAFYVGGDDALVLVPLDQLTAVMRTMCDHFSTSMGNDPRFTLTSGVVVAHVKDDLRWVRRQASEAIKSAKRQRSKDVPSSDPDWTPSGWAEIREQPRSGAARKCCGRVRDLLDGVDAFVENTANGGLSQRTPQLMLELGTLVPSRRPTNAEEQTLTVAARELARSRALAQLGRSSKGSARTAIETALADDLPGAWDRVVDLAARMKLAARIAAAKGDR